MAIWGDASKYVFKPFRVKSNRLTSSNYSNYKEFNVIQFKLILLYKVMLKWFYVCIKKNQAFFLIIRMMRSYKKKDYLISK